MKILCIAIVLSLACAFSLGGCARCAPSKAAVSPQSGSKGGVQTMQEDRAALDKYIRANIGWPDGGGSYQGAPNVKDKEHARSLDPTVLQNVREYLKADEYYKQRFPCIVTIEAARPVCGFLLLDLSFDIPTGEHLMDGNCHLIYSPSQARVVGKFRWYPQG